MNELEKLSNDLAEEENRKSENLSKMILDQCQKFQSVHDKIIFDEADIFEIKNSMEFTEKEVYRAVYNYFFPG